VTHLNSIFDILQIHIHKEKSYGGVMLIATVKKFLFQKGIIVSRVRSLGLNIPIELEQEDIDIVNYVRANDLSMGSTQNLFTTVLACKYVIDSQIEGDFVECGVFRGGHSIIAASIFKRFGVSKRIFLFDTFTGMSEPSLYDFKHGFNIPAMEKYKQSIKKNHVDWDYCSLTEVKNNFIKLNLLDDNIFFVEGNVMNTISVNQTNLGSISILRLDTDFYESTKHEFECLYPILSENGVLVVDDYGAWAGSKKATDEYFKNRKRPFFSLVEGGARVGIKI
jgi:hypothetical protein